MKVGLGFRNRLRGDLAAVGQELDLTHQALVGWREAEHDVEGGHTDITATGLDLDGLFALGGPYQVNAAYVLTPPQIVANQNNYNPPGLADASILRVTTDASRTISGIVTDPRYNRKLWVINAGNFDVGFLHNSTASTQLYRIGCPMSNTVTMSSGSSALLYYDVHAGNWRIISAIGNVSGVSNNAPYDADYLVKTANANLTAERVVTDNTEITFDWSVAGVIKAVLGAFTGDVTRSVGSLALTIANDAVTNAKAANMAQDTIKGRADAAGTGDPTDLTANQVSTILDTATDPFLRTSAGGGGAYSDEQAQDAVGTILTDTATIDFTYTDATPSITASVIDASITYAKIQDISATQRALGRNSAGSGDTEEVTITQLLDWTS